MGSSGRSFAKKEPLTDAERLDEAERKYEVIREKIQVYDSIVQNQIELKKQVDENSKKPEELARKLNDLKEESEKKISASNSLIRGIEERIGWGESDARNLNKAIDDLRELFKINAGELSSRIRDVSDKIPQAVGQKADDKDLQDFKILHTDQWHDIKRLMQAQDKIAEEMKQEIQAIAEGLQDHNDKFAEQAKATQSITVWLNSFEEKMNKKFASLSDAMSANAKDFQEKMQAANKAAKDEIIGTPSSNAAVEARIMNRLEMATLDGSNAVTIARNSADKIKLLEKKIEALTSQLSKFELPR